MRLPVATVSSTLPQRSKRDRAEHKIMPEVAARQRMSRFVKVTPKDVALVVASQFELIS